MLRVFTILLGIACVIMAYFEFEMAHFRWEDDKWFYRVGDERQKRAATHSLVIVITLILGLVVIIIGLIG